MDGTQDSPHTIWHHLSTGYSERLWISVSFLLLDVIHLVSLDLHQSRLQEDIHLEIPREKENEVTT